MTNQYAEQFSLFEKKNNSHCFFTCSGQDDDEADTVGCCTLKVDHVECIHPNQLKVVTGS